MDRRLPQLLALIVAAFLLSSCSTSLFKVKPATELPPLPPASHINEAGSVTFRVAPLLSDEEVQDLFETNLALAGILPVRLELSLKDGAPIELKRARFSVHDSQNREWKLLSTKQTVSRVMKANGISLYNPNSKKQFQSDLAAYGLDLKNPLDSTQPKRHGFLFFQTPDKRPVDYNQKLTLIVDKLPQSTSIELN